MTDDNPAVTAALEAALQSAIDSVAPDCMLTDWVVTAIAVKLSEIGERSKTVHIGKPGQSVVVTRGIAVTSADFWRGSRREDG